MREFVTYVLSFYGEGGIYAEFFPRGVKKADVEEALKIRLRLSPEFAGDSFDRELVRDIMLMSRGETELEYSHILRRK